MSWPFYHRNVGRLQAEELLLGNKADGSYLVRDSESYPGAYALCLIYQGRIHTYRILPDGQGKLYLESSRPEIRRRFVDIGQLVHECEQRGESGQFVCGLKYPVHVCDEDDSDKESDDELDGEDSSQQSQEDNITRFFLQNYASLDLTGFDEKFVADLRQYIESGVTADALSVSSGDGKPKVLLKLLASSASDLYRSMQEYLRRVQVFQRLFEHSDPAQTRTDVKDEDLKLPLVVEKLTSVQEAISQIQKKAVKQFKEIDVADYEEIEKEESVSVSERSFALDKTSVKMYIPPSNFNVKMIGLGKLTQRDVVLTVDLQAGKLYTVRPSKEALDASNTFTHDRITQLVKCTSNSCRLDMKIDDRKKETYVFEDARQREHFCQLIQQMKNMHSESQNVDQISLYIGTWNMGAAVPFGDLAPWLKSQGLGRSRDAALSVIPHDLYVIGTQESSLSEKDWQNRIRDALSGLSMPNNLHVVATASLWDIRLVVFVRTEYKNKISHIQTANVGTGIANTLGNKGGVGISFHFDGTALCFINCHLASGHEPHRWKRRNQNFRDIIRSLKVSLSNKQMATFDLTNQFHHLFWFGDLNYRLEMSQVQEILKYIRDDNYHPLLQKDQLRLSQERLEAFHNFDEEDITFKPTYRFEKGTHLKYAWEKVKKSGVRINVPSWCDRVLWKCYPETYISCTSYGTVPGICSSDHKPVFATFNVGISSQYVSSNIESNPTPDLRIVFQTISAKVKTRSKQRFLLELYSSCLDGSKSSRANDQYDSSDNVYCHPRWTADSIPELVPIVGDMEYLTDQHLLVAVKGVEGMESYGECVIALKSMFGVTPQPFEYELTHHGEPTGILRGFLNVRSESQQSLFASRRRLKSYELIYMDTQLLQREAQEADSSSRTAEPLLSVPTPFPANRPLPRLAEMGGAQYVNVTNPSKQKTDDVSVKYNAKMESVTVAESDQSKGSSGVYDDVPTAAPRRFVEGDQSKGSVGGVYDDVPSAPPRKPRLGQSSFTQTSVLPAVSPTSPSVAVASKATPGNSLLAPPVVIPAPRSNQSQQSTSQQPAAMATRSKPSNGSVVPPPVPPHATKLNSPLPPPVPAHATKPSKIAGGKVTPPPVPPHGKPLQACLSNPISAINQGFRRVHSKRDAMVVKPQCTAVYSEVPVDNKVHDSSCNEAKFTLPNKTSTSKYKIKSDMETYVDLRRPQTVNEWLLNVGLPQYIGAFLAEGWDQMAFVDDITEQHLIQMKIYNKQHRTRILDSIADFRRDAP